MNTDYCLCLFIHVATQAEQNEAVETISDCCACGAAKYKVTFDGLWTKYSHPKDFPEREYTIDSLPIYCLVLSIRV